MEDFTDKENIPVKIEEEDILEMLRVNGPKDPKTIEMVMQWTKQQEVLVETENTSCAAILFNIEQSNLFVAAGDIEGAIGCLWDAETQALEAGEVELYEQIKEKIGEMEMRKN